MQWIYLSPHLDDVALSVGGIVWEQVRRGDRVAIWTICAGDPPPGPLSPFAASLHARWQVGREALAVRRAEDIHSCQALGADFRHFEVPDCIYRRSPLTGEHLYASEEALWVAVHPAEAALVDQISAWLGAAQRPDLQWVCPFSLGQHVDHRLTRLAAERAQLPLWFYADYPYILQAGAAWPPSGLAATSWAVGAAGLLAWQQAVAAHSSQISTFWADLDEMRAAIADYAAAGVQLWCGPER
ncbi:MAG: PIG-L family deacetylase [Anaerolineales bacterium]|nr:PIG-L family deacetylase [Anaerolineales bacterium]